MMTTDVLDHLRATLWRFSDRELDELLRAAAQEISRRDFGAGYLISWARAELTASSRRRAAEHRPDPLRHPPTR